MGGWGTPGNGLLHLVGHFSVGYRLDLAGEEEWEQKVEFRLYKGNENTPYHTLGLWVDVVGS